MRQLSFPVSQNVFKRKLGECYLFRCLFYQRGSLYPRCKVRELSRNRYCIRELLPATFSLTIRTLLSHCLSLSLSHTHTQTHDSTQFRAQNGPLLLPVYYASARFANLRLRFPIHPYFSPVAVFRDNCVLTAFSIVPAPAMILDCSSAYIRHSTRDKQSHRPPGT